MKILGILVKNYKGLNINIKSNNDFENKNIIVYGENSSGKTNFLNTIQILFDRKKLLSVLQKDNSFFDDDTKGIFISCILKLDNKDLNKTLYEEFRVNNFLILSLKFVWDDNMDEIKWYSFQNSVPNEYLEELFKNHKEIENVDWKEQEHLNFIKNIDVLYIPPNFEILKEKTNFFKSYLKNEIDKNDNFKSEIKSEIDEIIKLSDEKSNIRNLKNNTTIELDNSKSEISILRKLESLEKSDIIFKDEHGVIVDSLGDGYNRYFSMIYKIKEKIISISKTNRKFILLIEEPENNFSILWQTKVIDKIRNDYNNKILFDIMTTHSPNQINMSNNKNLFIKLNNGEANVSNFNIEIFNKNRHLNPIENLLSANSIFYNNVLLVEGISEEIFYNFLFEVNDEYREFIKNNSLFIMPVRNSTPNYRNLNFYKELKIKVGIKIDNDISANEVEKRKENIKSIERNQNITDEEMFDKGYFLSNHNDSFEGDIKELLEKIEFNFESPIIKEDTRKVEKIRDLINNTNFKNKIKNLTLENLKSLQIAKWIKYYEN